MDVSEILVTGGTGLLGRRVADRLGATGAGVRVLSHSGRAGTVRGDLSTGEGLEEAVRDVDAIVHCASSPLRKAKQVDVRGTDRLLRAAAGDGVSHVVYISIVGVDRNPWYPYYRAKLEAERVVERSSVPWTILRAAQFHEFVLGTIKLFERGPFAVLPKGFLLQPVDIGEVAGRLVELTLAAPAGRVPDVCGPEVRTFGDLARSYLEATGRQRRILELPLPGRFARAFREGAHVCPERADDGITWEQFLSETLR